MDRSLRSGGVRSSYLNPIRLSECFFRIWFFVVSSSGKVPGKFYEMMFNQSLAQLKIMHSWVQHEDGNCSPRTTFLWGCPYQHRNSSTILCVPGTNNNCRHCHTSNCADRSWVWPVQRIPHHSARWTVSSPSWFHAVFQFVNGCSWNYSACLIARNIRLYLSPGPVSSRNAFAAALATAFITPHIRSVIILK